MLLGIAFGAGAVSALSAYVDLGRDGSLAREQLIAHAPALATTPLASDSVDDGPNDLPQDVGSIVKCSAADKVAGCEPDVTFELEAKNIAYEGEGVQRVYSVFNKMMQGPTHWVELNDVVRVHVTNGLGTSGLSVHHHGIHQAGTPFFDGSAMITQGQIPAGGSMDYQFRAWPVGTHWYHGHSGADYADGLRGMIIVRDPADPYREYYHNEEALLVYDANSQMSATEYITYYNYYPKDFDGFPWTGGMVNGQVRYMREVALGQVWRIRLGCGGYNWQFIAEIDGHDMTVIAVQGSFIKPVRTKRLRIRPAERYDVLVKFHTPGLHRMSFRAQAHGTEKFFGYDGHPDITPEARSGRNRGDRNITKVEYPSFGMINMTFDVRDYGTPRGPEVPEAPVFNALADHELDLVTPGSIRIDTNLEPSPPATADRVIPVVLTAGFAYTEKNGTFVKGVPGDSANPTTTKWLFNNNSWVDPSVPLYASKGKYGVSTAPHFETRVVPVKLGEVIDLVVVNSGLGSAPEEHPLHLHGYKFWVVGFGDLPYPIDQIERGEYPPLNLDDPPLVDTFPMHTGKYAILRFVASNPGMWHLHCHLLEHMLSGLQMVLNVGEEHQPEPTAAWYAGHTYGGAVCKSI